MIEQKRYSELNIIAIEHKPVSAMPGSSSDAPEYKPVSAMPTSGPACKCIRCAKRPQEKEVYCLRCYDRADPVVRELEKIPRNSRCPCGSGKKFKKCCTGSKK